jgi:hypothetical protein
MSGSAWLSTDRGTAARLALISSVDRRHLGTPRRRRIVLTLDPAASVRSNGLVRPDVCRPEMPRVGRSQFDLQSLFQFPLLFHLGPEARPLEREFENTRAPLNCRRGPV